MSTNPKNRNLNQGVLHFWSNLVILIWTGDKLSHEQTQGWHTDGRTHTYAGNDNTRSPKLASGNNYHVYVIVNTISYVYAVTEINNINNQKQDVKP